MRDHPNSYVIPQRYEKKWGNPPGLIDIDHLHRAPNKCTPKDGVPLYTATSGQVEVSEIT